MSLETKMRPEHANDREERTRTAIGFTISDEDGAAVLACALHETFCNPRLANARFTAHDHSADGADVASGRAQRIPSLVQDRHLALAPDERGEHAPGRLQTIDRMGRTDDAQDFDVLGDALHRRSPERFQFEVAAHDIGGGVADRDLARGRGGFHPRRLVRRQTDDCVTFRRVR